MESTLCSDLNGYSNLPTPSPTTQMIAKCMIPNSTYLAWRPYTIILEGIYAPDYVSLVTRCASSPEHTADGGLIP